MDRTQRNVACGHALGCQHPDYPPALPGNTTDMGLDLGKIRVFLEFREKNVQPDRFAVQKKATINTYGFLAMSIKF